MNDLEKELTTIKQALQKLQYAKELVTEAVSQVCQLPKPKSEIESEPILVAVHVQDYQKDDIFILAYQVSKLLKNEWSFVERTLQRIEEAQLEKIKSNNPASPNHETQTQQKNFTIVGTHPET